MVEDDQVVGDVGGSPNTIDFIAVQSEYFVLLPNVIALTLKKYSWPGSKLLVISACPTVTGCSLEPRVIDDTPLGLLSKYLFVDVH